GVQASHKGRKTSSTVRRGSLFERSKVSLASWMTFIYSFSQGLRLRQSDMVEDQLAGSSRTLSKMAKVLRGICKTVMKNYRRRQGQVVGGGQEFAVIDESCFRHKRKYHRGRAAATWRRKKWVFGILGVGGRRNCPVLRLVRRRRRENLIPILVKHVRPGTTVISDQWGAYRRALAALGYRHFTVNHSQWFVDPNTRAHTQHIERAWLKYKSTIWRLRGNRTETLLKDHLCLIEWTHWLGNVHRNGTLGRLLRDIRHMRSQYYNNAPVS
ncbi:uncharacterized protein LOC134458829, partial [Engraulis encrasicolus]|uniref:uncharacterized protein LOC134458829 n=1 Tax=Engraulis encrasicolus TaxID=184585 RepID=UPI002FD5E706